MYELTGTLPAWVPYAATGVGSALLAAAAAWAVTRRGRARRSAAPRSTSRTEDTLTFIVAAIVAGICAQGMGRFFLDKLGFPLPIVIAIGGVLELVAFTCALRARRSVRDTGRAGIDGIAVWAVAAASGTFAALDTGDAITGLFRIFSALLAAWLWERGMAIERRYRRNLLGDRKDGINWLAITERIAVRLGLADTRPRTVQEVDTERRLNRVVRAAVRLRKLQQSKAWKWRQHRAENHLDKAMVSAIEHTDLAHDRALQEALLAELGAMYHATDLAALKSSASLAPEMTVSRPVICSGSEGLFLCRPKRKKKPPADTGLAVGARIYDMDLVLSGSHSPVVYFIVNGDRVKIGTTTNLRRRVRALALRIENIALVLSGDQGHEAMLHERFATYRDGDSEWFELRDEVAQFIAAGGLLSPAAYHAVLSTAGATDNGAPGVNSVASGQETPAAGTGANGNANPAPTRRSTGHHSAKSRRKGGGKARRSMTEWVQHASPIFHAELARLHRQPTGDEFADAIKKAGLGTVSASTAKNIRAEILDRAPVPALDELTPTADKHPATDTETPS